MCSWLQKTTIKARFGDEEFFGMSSYTSWKNYHLILKLFNLYHTTPKRMCYQYFSNFLFFQFLTKFHEFFSMTEYSEPIEYSIQHKKFFWTTIFVKNLRFFFSRYLDENSQKSRPPYPPPKTWVLGGG